jgi:hypothetical protein
MLSLHTSGVTFTLTNPPKSTQQVQQTDKAADKDTGPERESPQPHGSGVYPPTVLQNPATTHTSGTKTPQREPTQQESPRLYVSPYASEAPTLRIPGVGMLPGPTKRVRESAQVPTPATDTSVGGLRLVRMPERMLYQYF